MEFADIDPEDVTIGPRHRSVTETKVKALAESMQQIGSSIISGTTPRATQLGALRRRSSGVHELPCQILHRRRRQKSDCRPFACTIQPDVPTSCDMTVRVRSRPLV